MCFFSPITRFSTYYRKSMYIYAYIPGENNNYARRARYQSSVASCAHKHYTSTPIIHGFRRINYRPARPRGILAPIKWKMDHIPSVYLVLAPERRTERETFAFQSARTESTAMISAERMLTTAITRALGAFSLFDERSPVSLYICRSNGI